MNVLFNVNGTRQMIYEGVLALQALQAEVELRGEDYEAAEIRIYENMPIEAVICGDMGAYTVVWNGEHWIDKEPVARGTNVVIADA